jgi:hypothetical protein
LRRCRWLGRESRTAVIAGTSIQLYWGSGDLVADGSSEQVASTVAAMFKNLIAA